MFPTSSASPATFPGGVLTLPTPVPTAIVTPFPGGAKISPIPGPDIGFARFPQQGAPTFTIGATGTGAHVAELLVAVEITAPASGAGVAENILIRTVIDAPAEGSGTAGVVLIPVAIATAPASASGVAGIIGVPVAVVVATAAASATGSATVTVGAVIAVAASGSGTASNAVALTAVGTCAASGSGAASHVVTTFRPSGMTKNGTLAWAGSATWVTITSWTANTGTYPGSSVDGSHRLVVQGSKTSASISGQAAYTGGGFARTHSIRLIDQSGNVIATGSPNTATSGNCTVSATGVNLSGVTAIALQMSGDFSAGTMSAGAGTFLTIT
ncbi:hypothetical protein ACFPPE_07265 [Agromyces tardus]|uniref:hypothetical protein n=1 Tax=Agromyces tardus TaxID=2583849 RepID=UPI0036076D9A